MIVKNSFKKLPLFGVISLVIIGSFIATHQAPIQFHLPKAIAASATCPDITGQSTAVNINGVPNAGILDFNNAMPSPDYQACLDDNGTNGQGPFLVKGWVWDSNLGWVSLYCGNEDNNLATPNTNLTLPCGDATTYQVTMEGQSGILGRLHGFAWGDNTGWISFNSAELPPGTPSFYVQAEATDPVCIGKVFVTDPSCASVTHAPESIYAWSDRVGWFNLTNVVFPLSAIVNPLPQGSGDVQTLFEITPNPSGLQQGAAPVADDSDGYDLMLHVVKKNDSSPIDPSLYTIKTEVVWAEDSVDLDQTDGSNGDYKNCGGNNCGAVTKPINFDQSAYGQGPHGDAFVSRVTSVAPTYSENGLSDGSMFFNDFILGHADTPPSNLIIDQVKISIVEKGSNNCIIGDSNNSCAPAVIWNGNKTAMPFRPAISLSKLDVNDPLSNSTLEARYNVAKELQYSTSCLGNLSNCNAVIQLQTGVDSPFDLVVDTNNDGADCTDAQTVNIPTVLAWARSQPGSFEITPVFESANGQCAKTGPAIGNNAFVYSTVNYNLSGKNVLYFSNKLPRTEGTLVSNPIANIKGQVYSQGVTNPQSGKEYHSLGDVSTNILRNTLARNVSNIVAGVESPKGDAFIKYYDKSMGFEADDTGAMQKLLPDDNGIPKVYYFKGNVTLGNGSDDISWNGERTLIIEGGNLTINSNLYNEPAGSYSGELGIIVLKNLQSGEGGNIYVGPNVTNIQASIFADQSLFTFDGTAQGLTGNAFGEPLFTDETQRFNTLKNQLYIQGSVATSNTIGGAVANPPFVGNGTLTSAIEGSYGQTPSGRRRARLYDLNFLRYYGLVFERDDNGNAKDKDGDGQLEATAYTGNASGGDLVILPDMKTAKGLDPAKDFSPVYITFKSPSPTLPGFGVTKGIDIKVRQ